MQARQIEQVKDLSTVAAAPANIATAVSAAPTLFMKFPRPFPVTGMQSGSFTPIGFGKKDATACDRMVYCVSFT